MIYRIITVKNNEISNKYKKEHWVLTFAKQYVTRKRLIIWLFDFEDAFLVEKYLNFCTKSKHTTTVKTKHGKSIFGNEGVMQFFNFWSIFLCFQLFVLIKLKAFLKKQQQQHYKETKTEGFLSFFLLLSKLISSCLW